jgi:hypothetical protein
MPAERDKQLDEAYNFINNWVESKTMFQDLDLYNQADPMELTLCIKESRSSPQIEEAI